MDTNKIGVPAAIVLAGIIIAGAIVYAFAYAPKTPSSAGNNPADVTIPPLTDADHRIGGADAELVFVEYSDLECPFCSQFHPVLEQALTEYGGKVAWVFRQFPLTQIHPEALPAAKASECVAKLKGNDAFWAFTSQLYEQQNSIGTPLYHSLAGSLGISATDLDACIADPTIEARIAADYKAAVEAGAQGTPFTVVLNKKGKTVHVFPGALQYPQLKAEIDTLLK